MKFAAALVVLLPLALASHIPEENPEGENWFVLVAGSDTWWNYRHQADICHAYQIMHANGVPDDHIIVMMKDDIADDYQNPEPGKIFNHPSKKDVYAGVPKDYTGDDVNIKTFFKVLQGDADGLNGIGSGKVVKSGPNDRIFINLDDHGGPGVFCFPYEDMTADEFGDVVKAMHAAGKYKEMMVYMESCYAGSMFKNIYPDDISFYALSASNSHESSWATYCDEDPYPCLGDLFSVNWMEDTDANDPATETLKQQFKTTKQLTDRSAVMQWGDKTIENEVVATFFSAKSNTGKSYLRNSEGSSVPSQDVPLFVLKRKLNSAKNDVERESVRQQITALKQKREFVKDTMMKIALSVTADEKLTEELMQDKHTDITNWDCYRPAVHAFSKNCFNLGQSSYGLTVLHTLVDLCEGGYKGNDILNTITHVCSFPTIYDAI